MRRAALLLFLLVALALSLLSGWGAAGLIEDSVARRLEAGRRAGGFDWLSFEVDGARIVARGQAPDAAAAARAQALVAALGLSIDADATTRAPDAAPPAAPPPPPQAALTIGAGSMALSGAAPEGCAARLAEALGADRLEDLTRSAGPAPQGWRGIEARAATLAGLLAQGRIEIGPDRLSLTGLPRDADARARLEAMRGPDIAIALLDDRAAEAVQAGAGVAGPGALAPPALRLERRGDGVLSLSGRVPDAATIDALEALARATQPGAALSIAVEAGAAVPAPGWRSAALAGLAALAPLLEGVAEIAPEAASLTGRALSPHDARRAALEFAAGALPASSRIAVDLDARRAAGKLGPLGCAQRLSEIVAAAPINFEPGEATIAGDSAATLDALAAALGRCGGGAVEVGGHTDSQGSAGYNLALSQSRAAAVVRALVDRGVDPALLSSRGYGESDPIADNDTEEGRALNRRTAFTPVVKEAGQ